MKYRLPCPSRTGSPAKHETISSALPQLPSFLRLDRKTAGPGRPFVLSPVNHSSVSSGVTNGRLSLPGVLTPGPRLTGSLHNLPSHFETYTSSPPRPPGLSAWKYRVLPSGAMGNS